ncbi:NAD(P)/FAD-dependent oxidoreductase [Yaniella halotolerans]|uniref:NAD(P)/FAD-dependent oxidoreductase n=1 Tax=Yaniella halotolerans TaxID=225453 RepID=UPI0003B47DB3|nr:FAD-dependent oxidoreductase [Yaniella halotolerans]
MPNTVILGGSVAGFSVAAGLRDAGYTGSVTIIDPHETALDRPPLSTEYLVGDDVDLALAPDTWFTDNAVTWVQDTALGFESGAVWTANQRFAADHIVIATGATPRTLDLPEPVYTFRTLADADALRDVLGPGVSVAIAGGGLLAPELATSAKQLGAQVTVYTPQVPATEIFGELAEQLYATMSDQVEVVPRRLTVDEELDRFDLVIAAVGVEPAVQVAENTGVTIDDGVVVDEHYRTNLAGVYAIGDVCRIHDQPRQDHWDHGRASAARVVHTIMGTEPDAPLPQWVWSDQFGHDAQAVGRVIPQAHEHLVHRGDNAIFVVDGDQLIGAAALDERMIIRAATRIISRGIAVDPEQLADTDISIRQLTRKR